MIFSKLIYQFLYIEFSFIDQQALFNISTEISKYHKTIGNLNTIDTRRVVMNCNESHRPVKN